MRTMMLFSSMALALAAQAGDAAAGGASAAPAPGSAGTAYLVATAHLDTQWRWPVRETIDEYLKNTLLDNFALLEAHPDYQFSFEGAFRYQLFKEYYPEEYQRVKRYVAEGRWHVCGSWLDAVDVNMPSPESLIRHALYGNGFFRREFGKTSVDVFLPDCFGFGWALPSVMAHCGLTGFSTQKLTWGSAYGTPFDVGVWRGVDGSEVVAAVNPGAYVSRLEGDLSRDPEIEAAIARTVAAGGPPVAYRYYGTGDTGGAPAESSVLALEASLRAGGPVRVRPAAADALYRELTPEQVASLPRWDGELVMTAHGAGCYTSQATMKRWNRRNEVLADAAERASVLAGWLGGLDYPRETLERAWTRFLWHQFHDDLTGTSIPEAYRISWNDELLSQREFAQTLTTAIGAATRGLHTAVQGRPIVVFNPLAGEREDLVTLAAAGPDGPCRVLDPDGREVPAQRKYGQWTFLAKAPSCGVAVYEVQDAALPQEDFPGPSWDAASGVLENGRYRLVVGAQGWTSLVDKTTGRELFDAPPRLQLLKDDPKNWAAWEIDFDDIMAEPTASVPLGGVPESVEIGPACARLRFRHEAAGSVFAQTLTLGAGDSEVLEWELEIDWATKATLLKAAFFTAARDTFATYDLGLGTIRRGVNRPELYEVPAQRWADVSDREGGFGLTVANDGRHGWDLPAPGVLRLSLLRTPAVNELWAWIDDEKSQDLGRHTLKIALAAHGPSWHPVAPRVADRLNQPLLAFEAQDKHAGARGRRLSLLAVDDGGRGAVAVKAVKRAEESEEWVVRLQETAGEALSGAALRAAGPILAVRELQGDEQPLPAGEDLRLENGVLRFDLGAWKPRTLALTVEAAADPVAKPLLVPLDLPWNVRGIAARGEVLDEGWDGAGGSLPSDLIPEEFERDGVLFRTGPREAGAANLLRGEGQRVPLTNDPELRNVQLIACAIEDGVRIPGPPGHPLPGPAFDYLRTREVPRADAAFGSWDSRLEGEDTHHEAADLVPGFVQPVDLGWIVTHRSDPEGMARAYTPTVFYRMEHWYMRPYKYIVNTAITDPFIYVPKGLLVLAATQTDARAYEVRPCQPLVERFDRPDLAILTPRREFVDEAVVELASHAPDCEIRYSLDGSVPGPDAPLYRGPIRLAESAELRAVAVAPGFAESTERRARFEKRIPRPADPQAPAPETLRPGLRVKGYEGAWETLPDFDGLTPLFEEAGVVVDIPGRLRDEDVGAVLEGWLLVPHDGLLRLSLSSDDGSRLWLDGELAIDHDGLHGDTPLSADLALAAGPHRLRIDFFQHLGGRALGLSWTGPGVESGPVPLEALRHRP